MKFHIGFLHISVGQQYNTRTFDFVNMLVVLYIKRNNETIIHINGSQKVLLLRQRDMKCNLGKRFAVLSHCESTNDQKSLLFRT